MNKRLQENNFQEAVVELTIERHNNRKNLNLDRIAY